MEIDKFQEKIERDLARMTESLDKDDFDSWKNQPMTMLFMKDIESIFLDRMKSLSTRQPVDECGRVLQSKDRGYLECLADIAGWDPYKDDENNG